MILIVTMSERGVSCEFSGQEIANKLSAGDKFSSDGKFISWKGLFLYKRERVAET